MITCDADIAILRVAFGVSAEHGVPMIFPCAHANRCKWPMTIGVVEGNAHTRCSRSSGSVLDGIRLDLHFCGKSQQISRGSDK